MRFGILQRYVIDQVMRAFLMALLAITAIFVLFIVMAEATREGLSPQDVVRIVPFVVPGSLPYTVPVALLFAVSVVYGRIAGDNEVVAIKAAGLNVVTILKPTLFLGAVLSGALILLSGQFIPRANHAFKQLIFSGLEDLFYKHLKKEGEFNRPDWDFYIKVQDVQGKVLIQPTFKHRSRTPDDPDPFDAEVEADRAIIEFFPELEKPMARITLENARMRSNSKRPVYFWIDGRKRLEYPLPTKKGEPDARVQELTNPQIRLKQAELREKVRTERQRQAIQAVLWMSSGRLERVDWPGVQSAYADYAYWLRKVQELETEYQLRAALACGGFFFVLIGAPVGIMFARRDFLSAFITCFVPIIVVYYPLILAGVNLGKEGVVSPFLVWGGNAVLALLAGFFVYPPIMKH